MLFVAGGRGCSLAVGFPTKTRSTKKPNSFLSGLGTRGCETGGALDHAAPLGANAKALADRLAEVEETEDEEATGKDESSAMGLGYSVFTRSLMASYCLFVLSLVVHDIVSGLKNLKLCV